MRHSIRRLPKQTVIAALGALSLIGAGCSGLFGPDDGRAGMAFVSMTPPECVAQRQCGA